MKRTPLRKVSPNKVKKTRTSIYKWKPPTWLGGIPQGSHGSTSIQKKAWKVVSDFVRIRDFNLYGGVCPGCNEWKFDSYKDGQCCHWKRWTNCHAYGKYEIRNLILGCANCNKFGEDGVVGFNFGMELIRRYGADNPEYVENVNKEYRGKKLEDIVLVGMIEIIIDKMKVLPEKPAYYEKVINHKSYLIN